MYQLSLINTTSLFTVSDGPTDFWILVSVVYRFWICGFDTRDRFGDISVVVSPAEVFFLQVRK